MGRWSLKTTITGVSESDRRAIRGGRTGKRDAKRNPCGHRVVNRGEDRCVAPIFVEKEEIEQREEFPWSHDDVFQQQQPPRILV
jgi:hypothetical protein